MIERTPLANGHDVAAALATVRADIDRFCQQHGRASGAVELLAVSKTKPLSAIAKALEAGQQAFGENYVDEAVTKITTLDNPRLAWHFIGAIQSRRCDAIAAHFQWAHGVDRAKIARRLSERRPEGLPPLNICIQLNLDGEASKAGVAPDELAALAELCEELPGVRLRGLMTIPAPREHFDDQRRAFAAVREHFDTLRTRGHTQLDTLSMGMSADLEAAIAEGATIVRVGTALFGARDKPGSTGDGPQAGS